MSDYPDYEFRDDAAVVNCPAEGCDWLILCWTADLYPTPHDPDPVADAAFRSHWDEAHRTDRPV